MIFDEFNQTELVQLATHCDVRNASRALPRAVIIEHIQTLQDIVSYSPLNEYKIRMSAWLNHYWTAKGDLQKPAFRPCPDCTMCTDLQIVDCYEQNGDQIDLWRKTK
jgi:hypothetical protein